MWKGDQPPLERRPARPATPAPSKPVPRQKKHLAHKPHQALEGNLRNRAPELIKLGRHQMHPIQRRPAALTTPEKE